MRSNYSVQVKRKIKENPSKKIWRYSDFENIPIHSLNKILGALIKQGFIKRVEKGLYFYPQKTIFCEKELGETIPYPLDIIYTKLKNKGYFVCESGLNGFNKIGLTTQVPGVTYLACDHLILKKIPGIIFIHRPKPHSGTAIERIFLDALRNLEKIPDTSADKALAHLKKLITLQNVHIDDLLISCQKEPPRVRALVGALAQELSVDNKRLQTIKSSLNSFTNYYFKFPINLKYGHLWGIKNVSIRK